MSEHTRTPGRIDEQTTPVDGSTIASDIGYLRTGNVDREPGSVEDPSEVIQDNHINAQSVEIIDPELVRRSPWKFVFQLLTISIIIWLFYEIGAAIAGIWQQSTWLGLPLTLLACIFLVALGLASLREYKALNAIDTLADRHARMHAALASNNLLDLRETLEPTLNSLRQRHSSRIAEFEEAAKSRDTASEYLKQFENIVLIQLDKEASKAIERSALAGGAVVAIVPHPALDAAVALWRATVLVRKIGEIYGLEPTGLSSLRLLRHSISTAIIAGSSSIATELMLEQVGQDAVNRTFSSLGEGAVTAWRLYRLGYYAQNLCRPMTN